MKTIAIKHSALSLVAIFALSSCGDSGKDNPMEIPIPKVDFPLPKVNKDRPKEGREAIFNVPWTSLDAPKRKGNVFGKSYLLLTENKITKVVMCSQIMVITGERKWITPTAAADIAFDKDNFTTLNKEAVVAKENLEGVPCAIAVPATTTYSYVLKNNGETLQLTTKDADGESITEELIIFRN